MDESLPEELLDVLLSLPEGDRERTLSLIERTTYGSHPMLRALRASLADQDGLKHRLRALSSQPSLRPAKEIADVPDVIGRYHVLRRLGQGGMGDVFLAEQRAPLHRLVAVKLIRAGLDTSAVIARFEQERQALARMDHRNICRVLDAGRTPPGRPYFVMEYIPGVPLTQLADEQKMSIRERLLLFLQACDGVAHAHTKGILHRDLKPTNLLAWLDAETGRPELRVIDFGIAEALTFNRGAKVAGAAHISIGTPEYMSPEQAADSPADADTRTDVYSLGVVLFELVAGVRGSVPAEISDQAMRLEVTEAAQIAEKRGGLTPVSLSRLLRRELNWIPVKATQSDRERRYQSVAALAGDVRRYLAGEPLLAGHNSRVYQGRKFLARHAALFAGVFTVVLALIVAVTVTSLSLVRQVRARRTAEEAGAASRKALYIANLAVASDAARAADGLRLRRALDSVPGAARGWEWHWLDRQTRVPEVRLQLGDGQLAQTTIAVDNRLAFSQLRSGDMWLLWDIGTGVVVRSEKALAIAVVPGGRAYARLAPCGEVSLIDTASGNVRWSVPPRRVERPWQMALSSILLDGSSLLCWDGVENELGRVEINTGKLEVVRCTTILSKPPTVFPDPTAESSPQGFVLDADPGGNRFKIDPHTGQCQPAMQDWDSNHRQLFSPEFGSRVQPIAPNSTQVLLPKRGWCAKGLFKPAVAILDTSAIPKPADNHLLFDTPQRTLDIIPLSATAWMVDATPDDTKLLVTLLDGNAVAIPADARREPGIPVPGAQVLSRSPDGSRLLFLNWGDVTCVDGTTGLPLWGRNLGPAQNRCAAWDGADGRVAIASDAAGNGSADLFILEARTGRQLAAWSPSPVEADSAHNFPVPWGGAVKGMAFTPDGRELWVGRSDGSISRVDAARWVEVERTPALHPALAECAWLVSPDGKTVANFAFDLQHMEDESQASVAIYELTGPLAPRARLTQPGFMPSVVAWSEDSSRLAVAWFNASSAWIEILDRTGKVRQAFPATPGGRFYSLAFTPAADRLLGGREDGNIVVIDANNGESLLNTNRYGFIRMMAPDRSGGVVVLDNQSHFFFLDAKELSPADFAEALRDWPEGPSTPRDCDDARRWVSAACAALRRNEKSVLGRTETLKQDSALTPIERSLALLIDCRVPQSVNLLNSGALSICNDPAELPKAITMLREAVRIEPNSISFQSNLGGMLFTAGRLSDSIASLEEAQRLLRASGRREDASDQLRIAITKHRLHSTDDDAFAKRLTADLAAARLQTDADTELLLNLARREGALLP